MNLKETILKVAVKNKKFQINQILAITGRDYSRQFVLQKINDLIKDKYLIKSGKTSATFYALPKYRNYLNNVIAKTLNNTKLLEEHKVLFNIEKQADYFLTLKENIKSIFEYAFSEMLNNAIDHSESKKIYLEVKKNNSNLSFTIRDFGIGVFRSVMLKKKLRSELEAIQDLLKGKTTTAPKAHSGEGIFFTSKAVDVFTLESYNYRLIINNLINDIFLEEIKYPIKGTRVMIDIGIFSKRHLNTIFEKYQTDPEEYGFDKTEIMIKLYNMGSIYISRSQARRIIHNLDKFKSIIFNFDKVPTVGQAFADEIFRVFNIKHPNIKISAIKMNKTVEFMVKRAGYDII